MSLCHKIGFTIIPGTSEIRFNLCSVCSKVSFLSVVAREDMVGVSPLHVVGDTP